MPNETNRRNLKAQMDLLSDAHAGITEQAAKVNDTLIKADESAEKQGKPATLYINCASRRMEQLGALIVAQEARLARVQCEIEEIRKNLMVI